MQWSQAARKTPTDWALMIMESNQLPWNFLGKNKESGAQYLVGFVQLASRAADVGFVIKPEHGRISCLGFAESGIPKIASYAPSAIPAGSQFYSDKFITIEPSDELDCLGCAEIREAYVYDEHYRSDVDLTGLRLVLHLERYAFELYKKFIGDARVPALMASSDLWRGNLCVILPSPVFKFPSARGSVPPFPPAGTYSSKIGKLRTIQRIRFDKIDIFKVEAQSNLCEPIVPDIRRISKDKVLSLPSPEFQRLPETH